jgi:hypothetical protein
MHVLISSADQHKVALAAKELRQLLAQLKVSKPHYHLVITLVATTTSTDAAVYCMLLL